MSRAWEKAVKGALWLGLAGVIVGGVIGLAGGAVLGGMAAGAAGVAAGGLIFGLAEAISWGLSGLIIGGVLGGVYGAVTEERIVAVAPSVADARAPGTVERGQGLGPPELAVATAEERAAMLAAQPEAADTRFRSRLDQSRQPQATQRA